MNRLFLRKKSGMFVYDFILEELEEYKSSLRKQETSWKFWMLCATLLMFPLGTVLCYMALKIRYGQHIKRYKLVICRKLAKTEEEAILSVRKRSEEQGEACHYETSIADVYGTLSTELEIER